MKLPIRSLFIVLISIILACVIFLCVTEMKKESDLKQSTIDGLRVKNIMEKRAFERYNDSIQKAFSRQLDSIAVKHEKSLKANAVSQREIRTLKSILFVAHTDSSRNAELVKLYPSFKTLKP